MSFKAFCVFLISIFIGCKNLTSKNQDVPLADTIDFSTVDTSPSFENCNDLLGIPHTQCFRKTIQDNFLQELEEISFQSEIDIEEKIQLILHIDNNGSISIKEIESSRLIKDNFPDLTNKLKRIASSLPRLQPALKRGIPVATEYQLPIQINTRE